MAYKVFQLCAVAKQNVGDNVPQGHKSNFGAFLLSE